MVNGIQIQVYLGNGAISLEEGGEMTAKEL